MPRYFGVDLAWGLGLAHPVTGRTKKVNETGLCLLDATGRILDAGWERGPDAVFTWIDRHLSDGSNNGDGDIIAIGAPLIVPNPTGMRECEREVGRGYGRWKVGANASNQALASRAGAVLLDLLETRGVTYTDGTTTPAPGQSVAFECYPYTTIVGVDELGYDVERPRYKRLIPHLPRGEANRARADNCDELIRRMIGLATATPPLDLRSHEITAHLVDEPSPLGSTAYKHREDLLDAALCAWTAALWHVHGASRTQCLGTADPANAQADARGRIAAIVAPARLTQWRPASPLRK